MEKLFYKKWSAILTVVAILLIVILLLVLLTGLTQLAMLKPRIAKLEQLVKEGGDKVQENKALLEYYKTDEYIRKWAEDHGYISKDDVLFIEKSK